MSKSAEQRFDIETLKACLAAQCDYCRELYVDGDEDQAAWGYEGEWFHSHDTVDCEASSIRFGVDPDGHLTGAVMCDAECPECHICYLKAGGHTCDSKETP